MTQPGKRAFWMHQAAEYMIAGAFVASGLQSPKPMLPTLMGGLIMINTACSKGPLAAFRVFGKRMHRLLDATLILLTIAVAAQPIVEIDNGTRGIMVLLAGAMAVIWLQSDFTERPPKVRKPPKRTAADVAAGRDAAPVASVARPVSQPDGSTADTIGRHAGRLAGKGVNIYRSRKSAQQDKQR
ncbi:MAG: hypothetical protein ABIR32_15600 [Ilumatobacteraceae bacterium]